MIGDIADSVCVSGSGPEAKPSIEKRGNVSETTVARVAHTQSDRQAAFRLRYEVYVTEQSKRYPEADHQTRTLTDELDHSAQVVIAERAGQVIATTRGNWFDEEHAVRKYGEMSCLVRSLRIPLERAGVCSRLAVHPAYRQSNAADLVLQKLYDLALERDTLLCFATCMTPLYRHFRRYGFREHAPPIEDPVVGTLRQMALILQDLEYLKVIGSPLFAVALARSIRSVRHPWVDSLLSTA